MEKPIICQDCGEKLIHIEGWQLVLPVVGWNAGKFKMTKIMGDRVCIEVYIKDGIEKVLNGTPKEIKRYNLLIFIWSYRRYFYWIFLFIQIIPIILILFLTPTAKILSIFSILLISLLHSVFWLANKLSYPYEHPIFNCIKHRVLIKGKLITVMIWDNERRRENIRIGFYRYYDEETKHYVVSIAGKDEYFRFHQLRPVRT